MRKNNVKSYNTQPPFFADNALDSWNRLWV